MGFEKRFRFRDKSEFPPPLPMQGRSSKTFSDSFFKLPGMNNLKKWHKFGSRNKISNEQKGQATINEVRDSIVTPIFEHTHHDSIQTDRMQLSKSDFLLPHTNQDLVIDFNNKSKRTPFKISAKKFRTFKRNEIYTSPYASIVKGQRKKKSAHDNRFEELSDSFDSPGSYSLPLTPFLGHTLSPVPFFSNKDLCCSKPNFYGKFPEKKKLERTNYCTSVTPIHPNLSKNSTNFFFNKSNDELMENLRLNFSDDSFSSVDSTNSNFSVNSSQPCKSALYKELVSKCSKMKQSFRNSTIKPRKPAAFEDKFFSQTETRTMNFETVTPTPKRSFSSFSLSEDSCSRATESANLDKFNSLRRPSLFSRTLNSTKPSLPHKPIFYPMSNIPTKHCTTKSTINVHSIPPDRISFSDQYCQLKGISFETSINNNATKNTLEHLTRANLHSNRKVLSCTHLNKYSVTDIPNCADKYEDYNNNEKNYLSPICPLTTSIYKNSLELQTSGRVKDLVSSFNKVVIDANTGADDKNKLGDGYSYFHRNRYSTVQTRSTSDWNLSNK